MPRHAKPPRIVPIAVADGMLLCAAGLAIVGSHVGPHPTATEQFTTAPEASEPVAHGGPLAIPTIGVLPPEPSVSGQSLQATTHRASSGRSAAQEGTWTSTAPRQSGSTPSPSTSSLTTPPPGTVLPSPTDSLPASTGGSGSDADPSTQPSESSPITSSGTPSEQPTSSEPSTPSTSPGGGASSPTQSSATCATAPIPALCELLSTEDASHD